MRASSLILVALATLPAAAQTSQPTQPTPPAKPTPAAKPDTPADDEAAVQQRTAALLQTLAFDKSLLGTIRMGLYLNAKNLGTMLIVVEAAPKGSGAVYKVSSKADVTFGASRNSVTEIVLLDAAFALVKLEGKQEEMAPNAAGGVSTRTKLLVQKGGKWVYTATHDEGQGAQTLTLTTPVQGPNHWEIGSLILLSRRVDLKTPGRYALKGIKWPELTTHGWAGPGGGKPAFNPVTIEVPKATKRKIRGVERDLVRVKSTRVGEAGGAQFLLLDPAGAFYGVEADQMPIKMLVGTEKEVTADLKQDPELVKVKAVITHWFEVVLKKKKSETLATIVDWEAYAATHKAADPSLKDKTTMDLVVQTKAALEGLQVPGGEEILSMLDMALKTTVKTDTATVSVQGPGKSPTWKLKKGKDGAWKLIDFPLSFR